MGETGDAELSEEVSETDSARPLRGLMGMGWEGAVLLVFWEDILLLCATTRERRSGCKGEGRKEELWFRRGAMRYMNRDFESEFQ